MTDIDNNIMLKQFVESNSQKITDIILFQLQQNNEQPTFENGKDVFFSLLDILDKTILDKILYQAEEID